MEKKDWDGKIERRIESLNIPYPLIGVICALVLQTCGGIWWAASMNATMGYIQAGQTELKLALSNSTMNRYTSIDAARDIATTDRRLIGIENLVNENKKYITELQIKVGKRYKKMEATDE